MPEKGFKGTAALVLVTAMWRRGGKVVGEGGNLGGAEPEWSRDRKFSRQNVRERELRAGEGNLSMTWRGRGEEVRGR
eukprot:CAMPEP_0114153436 /NCGR_PEP_ID=MMETSP0043_2-20121206/24356_1 /TAXON_ID=464988 /ORGANISM="Hemiselmis andersenii, Strain CCMP644" /LENGTH=76 /DNA_ID=CAMNT_0001248475 /DNA_START=34 /DNA_END=261 /DNA_ORIENTATION=-